MIPTDNERRGRSGHRTCACGLVVGIMLLVIALPVRSQAAVSDLRAGPTNSETQGQVANQSAIGPAVGSSNPTLDSSQFPGSSWLVQAINAGNSSQCNTNCTVFITPSQASTSIYASGTLPSGVSYVVTGGGIFGVCSITTSDRTFTSAPTGLPSSR